MTTSFRMEDKGPVISIKFSPDQQVLAIQRTKTSVVIFLLMSVGIVNNAVGWTTKEWWLDSQQERENYVFSIVLRPVLEFIQLSIQWILGTLSI
jgi:hypothetical protein